MDAPQPRPPLRLAAGLESAGVLRADDVAGDPLGILGDEGQAGFERGVGRGVDLADDAGSW